MSDLTVAERRALGAVIKDCWTHGEALTAIAAALVPLIEAREREAAARALESAADSADWADDEETGAWLHGRAEAVRNA